tara:strand:+ start:43 stop:801 length:759 start_codon:yes stop_codon:yes gene_type:complete
MKKLIVSGCSWGDKIFFSQLHPDMNCDWPKWPELLAQKLNMECVNLCKCGAGQEYIYSSISDYIQTINKNEIGCVIAAWSTAPRRCYKVKNRWVNDREDIRGDLAYWTERSIRYQYAFQNLMEQEKLPYLHFQMISLYRGHLWEVRNNKIAKENLKISEIENFNAEKLTAVGRRILDEDTELRTNVLTSIKNSPYYNKFNDKFFNWPTDEELGGFSIEFEVLEEKHKISKLDRHPNKLGHERIAEYLYDRME